ncbi:MAG TPA: electron transport complex subunit RsxE [Candidatus Brocadiia bacterium]|nr:electron transport complex subunit RsxE [Candidatus Brocadiales bacterium]
MSIAQTKGYKVFHDVFWKNNPTFGMILGICSALAVTNNALNTMVMGIAVTLTTCASSVTISLIRNVTPKRVRMAVYTVVIAVYVVFIDQYLKAYYPEMSSTLGAYVGLIITNCIVMGRAESFASSNGPWHSFLDALGTGLGYAVSLFVISLVREVLGFGSIMNIPLMGKWWESWVIMIIAPGGFFVLGIYMWVMRAITKPWIAKK